MSKTYRARHDDADLIQPGERHRVSMVAMDATQRQISQRAIPAVTDADDRIARVVSLTKQKLAADAGTAVLDAFGQGGAALRRPGYRITGDAATEALNAVRQARQQYLDDLTSAWQGDKGRNADDEDDDEGEGGKRKRKRKAQYRDPQGRETGTEEWDSGGQERRSATDKAYADYEADLVAAHRNWK